MPELPEVETTLRGLEPLVGHKFTRVEVRNPNLRQLVVPNLQQLVTGQKLVSLGRRAKYLLLQLERSWLVWHLGMSGSIRLDKPNLAVRTHDHISILSSAGYELRYHDPRRFGSLVYCTGDPHQLPALVQLGPEPLQQEFSATSLFLATRNKRTSIKQAIMDGRLVAGVGNIYAVEALFAAGVDPRLQAHRLTQAQAARLVTAIKHILAKAIATGGTTLRDFVSGLSQPGYFQQSLQVYGREGQNCVRCGTVLRLVTLGQRASVWCPGCQKKRDSKAQANTLA